MKYFIFITALTVLVFGLETTTSYAQSTEEPVSDEQTEIEHGPNFVDEDGDGFNDNAPDADGDGVPNGQDEDYDGPAGQRGKMAFIDEDGDGINDIAGDFDGDGVPNGLDPDFERGKALNAKKGNGRFMDADGDGINDNAMGMNRFGNRGGNAEAAGRGRYGARNGNGPHVRPDNSKGKGPGSAAEDRGNGASEDAGSNGNMGRRGQRVPPRN